MGGIPDGWVFTNAYSGATPVDLLVLPATPGVAHVIDAVELAGYANEAAAYGVIVSIKENGVVAIGSALAGIVTGNSQYVGINDSWTGPFAGASGAEVRITLVSGAPAGANQVFRMAGHAT